MRPLLAPLALAVILSGCVGSAPETAPAGQGEAIAPAGLDAAAPAPGAAPATFAPQEYDLSSGAYLTTPVQSAGMMPEAEVKVPEGARTVKASATWTPSTPASEELMLMVHLGAPEDDGEMLAGAMGASPLATEAAELPEGTTVLTVMCHVMGDPAGAEVQQDVHIVVEFA